MTFSTSRKLEAGKLTLENIPFNIREMINDTARCQRCRRMTNNWNSSLLVSQPIPDLVAG